MQTNYDMVLLGNPILRMVSQPFDIKEFGTQHLAELADALFHMLRIKQGIGLAAPQIGINKRVFVFGMENHPIRKNLPSIPYTILFNPAFTPISDIMVDDYEGCLSIGSLRAKVSRYKHIAYHGYDFNGNLIKGEASDLYARVVQHEMDHLNGIVFLDKVTDYQSLGFYNELAKSGQL